MNNLETITLEGTIYFDPEDKTNKHKSQTSWKKMAMVIIKGDVTQYYAWFIKKRFGLDLTKPLRGAHISFINDSIDEMTTHCKTKAEKRALWEKVKKKYHRKKIQIVLDIKPHIETPHWWLIVPHSERGELQAIRDELGFINRKTGLSKPFFGMHMTIGSAVDKRSDVKNDAGGTNAKLMNLAHSVYIKKLIDKGQIKF
jgi:hypothetical protein